MSDQKIVVTEKDEILFNEIISFLLKNIVVDATHLPLELPSSVKEELLGIISKHSLSYTKAIKAVIEQFDKSNCVGCETFAPSDPTCENSHLICRERLLELVEGLEDERI